MAAALALIAAAGAASVVAFDIGRAGADPSISAVGWWTRQPLASAPPEGGIAVADAPDGEVSVAALRIEVDGEVLSASLTLTEAGGSMQDQAGIRACAASDAWEPASGGGLDQAPEAMCDQGSVDLKRSQETWTADLSSILDGKIGSASVKLIPVEEPGAVLGSVTGWNVQFGPPELSARSRASTTRPVTTTSTTRATTAPTTTSAQAPSSPPATGAPSAAATTTRAAAPTTTTRATTPTVPASTAAPAAITPTAAAPGAGSSANPLPAQRLAGRSNPDRVRGFAIIPYVLVALALGAAGGFFRYASERGLLPGLRRRATT